MPAVDRIGPPPNNIRLLHSAPRRSHFHSDPGGTPLLGLGLACCARAASGHAAAALPSAASNSRRPMVTVIRPSRARCVKLMIPRHGCTVFTSCFASHRAPASLPKTRARDVPDTSPGVFIRARERRVQVLIWCAASGMCRNPASLAGGGVPTAGKHCGGGETSRKI
jgi:hypothetical protein